MSEQPAPASPSWGPTTKLVVALTVVAVVAALLVQFRGIIGPLLMAFVFAYLLHPVAGFLQRVLHLSWALTVAIIYLILFLFLLGTLTLGGLGLVQQIESLVSLVEDNISSLPDYIKNLSGQAYQLGPFLLDFRHLDMSQLSSQLLSTIQPLLGRTGTLLASLASSAAQFLGWALFILLVSYFVLVEAGGLGGRLLSVDVPGYSEDIQRLGHELRHIWNAFLRGQIIVFLLTVLSYTIALSILGVHYALGIAMLAGLAKFLPYVGPFITWTTLAMVAYFQPSNVYGLSHIWYTIVAVVVALLIDQVFDNFVTPRIVAQALKVHPAAVLVAALVAANLLGLLGMVVAAPILATVALFWRYTMRKMLDLNPWPEPKTAPLPVPASRLLARLRRFWRERTRRPG
jgi:predicted PurR-regulated permease PerM